MKGLLCTIGLLCALCAPAATHITFNNTTADTWSGEYAGQIFTLPPGTTEFDMTVDEPGAWCFVFGDEASGPAFGSDIFDEDGWTFEYTVDVDLVLDADKSESLGYPVYERVYSVTREIYPTP